MNLSSNLQPGIHRNADLFSQLSTYTGAMNDGEALILPPKPVCNYIHPGFSDRNRSHGWITSFVWSIGERVVHVLLPNASHTWSHSPYDIQMPSACTNATIFVEVKTSQMRNRGVIRTKQIDRYQERAESTDIYYAQVFYRMRDGRIPSKFSREDFEENFLPICIYIFPISFIIYLVNTIHPTGRREATQFYGLTHYRARSIFEMLYSKGLFHDDVMEKYSAKVFTTAHLPQNPEAQLHIIDHIDTPHILWHLKDDTQSFASLAWF